MRKIVIFFMVLLGTCNMLAQSVFVQKGITFRYNGKNPRTPLGGVYVKTATSPNGVVSDENNGVFFLKLQNIKMGDRLGRATVSKKGLMVFNQQAVDEWSARKEPLKLILCDANQFQKQKNNLISIGRNQAEKKYKKRLAELEKKNKAQQLTLDEYHAKLDSINRDRDNAEKHMDEYADMFARIDESEVDTLAQRAIELFNQGQLEEAIKLFEQGNYLEKLDDALKIKTQAEELRQKADSAEVLADKDIEEYKKSIQAQVSAYKMSNEWDKAAELLKGLADKLQTQDVIGDYARFSLTQNLFAEAETYYNIYIKKQLLLSKINPQKYEPALGDSYNNLGILYSDTQRFSDSEQMYNSALEIYKRLAATNPQTYDPDLAMSYNNLGVLYSDMQRFADSEQMHKSALKIYKRLADTNSQVYEPSLGDCYNNLGVLCRDMQRFADSEQMYKSALEIRKRLADANPQVYESSLGNSYNNLGVLYNDMQRFADSEQMFNSALEIYKRLMGENAHFYGQRLANCLFGLANSQVKQEKYSQAYQCFKRNIPLLKTLYQSDKSNYTELLNDILVSQSFYSIFEKQYVEAENYSKEALEVDSTKHVAYSNLAAALLFQGKYQEAEKIYRQYKSELKETFFSDFEEFSKAGVIPKNREEDIEKIKQLLLKE